MANLYIHAHRIPHPRSLMSCEMCCLSYVLSLNYLPSLVVSHALYLCENVAQWVAGVQFLYLQYAYLFSPPRYLVNNNLTSLPSGLLFLCKLLATSLFRSPERPQLTMFMHTNTRHMDPPNVSLTTLYFSCPSHRRFLGVDCVTYSVHSLTPLKFDPFHLLK